jgi:hypothetical protein
MEKMLRLYIYTVIGNSMFFGIIGKSIVFLTLLIGAGAFVLSKGGALALKSDNLLQG